MAGELIHYERGTERLGLIRAWRLSFRRARELYPGAEYFAWGSDHDVWEPGWLAALVDALDANPRAVLAYPLNDRGWRFDTANDSKAGRRFARTVRRMVAGDMVYGLFRVDALERCGVLRDVLLPDRLLMAELSLLGEFQQVPEVLWHRRAGPAFSVERQRRSLFGAGAPAAARLPWPIEHALALARAGRARYALPYVGLTYGFAAARRLARRA